ncbi:non-ribosomal peptide synthase [Sesbania bispinosa]|nr:non-ribosomal peptide synthase [Sesbania bispinosa]
MRKVGGATLQWLAVVVARPRCCDAVVAAKMRSCARRRRRTIANGDHLWPRRRLTDKGVDGLWGPQTTRNGGRASVRRRGRTATTKRDERRRSQAVAAAKAVAQGGGGSKVEKGCTQRLDGGAAAVVVHNCENLYADREYYHHRDSDLAEK